MSTNTKTNEPHLLDHALNVYRDWQRTNPSPSFEQKVDWMLHQVANTPVDNKKDFALKLASQIGQWDSSAMRD